MSKNSDLSKLVSTNANIALQLNSLTIANSTANTWVFSSNGTMLVGGTPVINSTGLVGGGFTNGSSIAVTNLDVTNNGVITVSNTVNVFANATLTRISVGNSTAYVHTTYSTAAGLAGLTVSSNARVSTLTAGSLETTAADFNSGTQVLQTDGDGLLRAYRYYPDEGYRLSEVSITSQIIKVASNTTVNLAINSTSISINGSIGTNGQVLTSNGTVSYWANAAGGGGGFTNGSSITVTNLDVTNSGVITVGNTTVNVFANATYISVGNSTVNSQLVAGNLALNGSVLKVGSGAANTIISNGTVTIASNSTVNNTINASSVDLRGSGATLRMGNATINSVVNSSSIILSGTGSNGSLIIPLGVYGGFISGNTFLIANSSIGEGPLSVFGGGLSLRSTSSLDYTTIGVGSIKTVKDNEVLFSVMPYYGGSGVITIGPGVALIANSSNGSAGQVLTSNGSGVYWSTPASGGGGGTLSIGNAVLLMWYDSSGGYYRMARGWVYKSNKQTSPSSSTLYFRFYDSYYTSSLNPSWSTVKDAPTGGAASWFTDESMESGASMFASDVSMDQLYGLEFYSDYNFAGNTSIMPLMTSMSASPGATLKYPSGGLGVGSPSVYSSFDSMTDATWGYAPNYYISFDYYLDGTQDSKIASFNYP